MALREAPPALVEFDDQRVQQRHRVELSLVGQADAAVERKRDVGFVDPFDGQARGLARLQFRARLGHPLLGLRVGVGILALNRDAVGLTVLDEPLLALAVSLDVLAGASRAVFADDLGQLAALQQAHFRGRVARRACSGELCLQHQNLLARPREQHGGDEPRYACADHRHVGRTFWQRIRRRRSVCSVLQPQ